MSLPRVAIVGAPNAGKSTLFNRLVGRPRSLVAGVPGLTRDLIEARADLAGTPVLLVDTGGLEHPGAPALAAAVRRKVLAEAARCDLLLLVVDARRGLTPLDEDLARLFRGSGRPILLIVNKVDGPDHDRALPEFARLGFAAEETLIVSAAHGIGVSGLRSAAAARLPESAAAPAEGPPIRVAIAGRPNVGKSSLLNSLLREERSLVQESPGTTRDSVDAALTRGGRRYLFVDTAGMRRRGRVERGPEALSVGAARRSVREADVTLVVFDAVEGIVAQDLHVLGLVAGGEGGWVRPAVILLNKIDLLPSGEEIARRVEDVRGRVKFARFAPVVPVSALRRLHLDRIFEAVESVEAESSRRLPREALDAWLREATARHRPPLLRGRPVALTSAEQTRSRPATIAIGTSRPGEVHFSYVRYLENSLRERFGIRLTPLVLRFLPRRRAARPGGGRSGGGARERRRRPSKAASN
jgi:GTP-binding protein